MNGVKLSCLGAALALVPILAGCRTARMAVPGFLAERAEVLECSGRQGFLRGEQFTCGDYRVEQVRRGWIRRISWDAEIAEGRTVRQESEYQIRTPEGVLWQGHAITGVRREDLKGKVGRGRWNWELTSETSYLVRFADEPMENFWTLAMAEGRGDAIMNGEFSDGETVYRVEGTYQLEGTPIGLSEPAGYIIYDGPRAVAAVEVINQGAVYLERGLAPDRRDALAAAAAALLLYRDISGR